MPTMDSLEDLLKDEIKDIYDAEKQLTKALPKLIKKATADDLKKALSAHLKETEGHIARLETGVRPDGHAGARQEVRGHAAPHRRRQRDDRASARRTAPATR